MRRRTHRLARPPRTPFLAMQPRAGGHTHAPRRRRRAACRSCSEQCRCSTTSTTTTRRRAQPARLRILTGKYTAECPPRERSEKAPVWRPLLGDARGVDHVVGQDSTSAKMIHRRGAAGRPSQLAFKRRRSCADAASAELGLHAPPALPEEGRRPRHVRWCGARRWRRAHSHFYTFSCIRSPVGSPHDRTHEPHTLTRCLYSCPRHTADGDATASSPRAAHGDRRRRAGAR